MSNLVKQSLEDNLSDILDNLPEEFHNDLKASIETASPAIRLTDREAKQLAAELMKENPVIMDKECVPMLDHDKTINKPITQPKAEELKLQMQHSLAEVIDSLNTE